MHIYIYMLCFLFTNDFPYLFAVHPPGRTDPGHHVHPQRFLWPQRGGGHQKPGALLSTETLEL